jgi:hypothetical protein
VQRETYFVSLFISFFRRFLLDFSVSSCVITIETSGYVPRSRLLTCLLSQSFCLFLRRDLEVCTVMELREISDSDGADSDQ